MVIKIKTDAHTGSNKTGVKLIHDAMHEISAMRDVCGRQGYRFWKSRHFAVRGIRARFKIGHRHKAVTNTFLDLRVMSQFLLNVWTAVR